jgi:hypothetical protein
VRLRCRSFPPLKKRINAKFLRPIDSSIWSRVTTAWKNNQIFWQNQLNYFKLLKIKQF